MASVLLIILGFLFMTPSSTAIGKVCGNGGNYTANSTYQSNLALLASTLPANTSSTQLFVNTTTGQSPNAVYALELCRGHIMTNLTTCSAYVASSFRPPLAAWVSAGFPAHSQGARPGEGSPG
jgi:hypothetical protein